MTPLSAPPLDAPLSEKTAERPQDQIQRTLAAITEWSNKAEEAHRQMDRSGAEWAIYLGNLRSEMAKLERLVGGVR